MLSNEEEVARMAVLVEFCGLPGTGKTTLSRRLAGEAGALLLRVDLIEAAIRRNGLVPGPAGYSVAHDLAAVHLRRGFDVVVDAVSAVEEAREGWRGLARDAGVRHLVVETRCADLDEHRRRVTARDSDLPGLVYPDWRQVLDRMREYQPRTDDRLVVDTTRPVADCHREVAAYLAGATPA
jgi:predicted kinase